MPQIRQCSLLLLLARVSKEVEPRRGQLCVQTSPVGSRHFVDPKARDLRETPLLNSRMERVRVLATVGD